MNMRTEQEMYGLIINTAKENKDIRAVLMSGSRADTTVKKDCFQDYDIIYIVTKIEPFNNKLWLKRFGEIMIMQEPNSMGEEALSPSHCLVYLMQFTDGTRIDLSITPLEYFQSNDELHVILFDKDSIFTKPIPSQKNKYCILPPTKKQFEDCCNEFWWLNPYLAKGLWRDELSYVKEHMEHYLRDEFLKMIHWYIGIKTNFNISTGKLGKYLNNYLTPIEWASFEKTYPDYKEETIWNSLFIMDEMFRDTAKFVAKHFCYFYPEEEDRKVTAYLCHVKNLPKTLVSVTVQPYR